MLLLALLLLRIDRCLSRGGHRVLLWHAWHTLCTHGHVLCRVVAGRHLLVVRRLLLSLLLRVLRLLLGGLLLGSLLLKRELLGHERVVRLERHG